ncbi:MAG TPA: hypothetical protein VGJ05_19295 [Fimbriiglobus sp.]|jgi:hypothetical protein
MPSYPVTCTARGCTAPAAFKVAAHWSDGVTHELKTYALTCTACLAGELASARVRRGVCRLAPEETLDEPDVYELQR